MGDKTQALEQSLGLDPPLVDNVLADDDRIAGKPDRLLLGNRVAEGAWGKWILKELQQEAIELPRIVVSE